MADNDVMLHERIFAQVLGVDDDEEFAVDLRYAAAEYLQHMPVGWEVVVGEGELAGIPLFRDLQSGQSHWNHPQEEDLKRQIDQRRGELIQYANEGEGEGEGGEQGGEGGEGGFQDFEVLFAQMLGVTQERHFIPLVTLAREIMQILPEGWEQLTTVAPDGSRVPYFFERGAGASHWTHPYEEQFRTLIERKRGELEEQEQLSARSGMDSLTQGSVKSDTSMAEERLNIVSDQFAISLGVVPAEEFAAELAEYARELLESLPEGWELSIAEEGGGFYAVYGEGQQQQLEHPLMQEHIKSIVDMRNVLQYGMMPEEMGSPQQGPSSVISKPDPRNALSELAAALELASQEQAEAERLMAGKRAAAAKALALLAAAEEQQAVLAAEAKANKIKKLRAELAAAEERERVERAERAAEVVRVEEERVRRVEQERLARAEEVRVAAVRAEEERQRVEAEARAEEAAAVVAAEVQRVKEEETEAKRVAEAAAEAAAEAQRVKEAEARAVEAAAVLLAEQQEAQRVAAAERVEAEARAAVEAAAEVERVKLELERLKAERAEVQRLRVEKAEAELRAREAEGVALAVAEAEAAVVAAEAAAVVAAEAAEAEAAAVVAAEAAEAEAKVEAEAEVEAAAKAAAEAAEAAAAAAELVRVAEWVALDVERKARMAGELRAAEEAEEVRVEAERAAALEEERVLALEVERVEKEREEERRVEVERVERIEADARLVAEADLAWRNVAREGEEREREEKEREERAEEGAKRGVDELRALLEAAEAETEAEVEAAMVKAKAAAKVGQQAAATKEEEVVAAVVEAEVVEVALAKLPAVVEEADAQGEGEEGAEKGEKEEEEGEKGEGEKGEKVREEGEKGEGEKERITEEPEDMSSTVDMGDMGGEGGEGGEGGVRDLGGAGAQDTDVGFDEMEREMEREGEGAGAEVVVAVKVEAEVVAVEVELGDGAGLLSALMSRRDTAPLPSSPDPASLSPLDSKTRKKRRKKVSPSKSKGSPKKTDVRRFDHPQRCWDISLDDPIKPVRWYFLGAYDRYDLAVRGRGAVVRMAVGDSGGTIILDPRVTVSDEEIAAEAGLKGTDGMGVTGTLGTGDMGGTGGMGGMGKGPGGQGELRGSNTLRRLNSLDAIGGGAVAEKPDTAEMILGRVRRKKDKTSKVRIRRDLTRMQWVLETDDKSVHKIASRHRKKTGVDMEGAADDGVAGQAKSALRKQAQAQVEEVDLVTRTLRSLPPMDQAIYQDITQVLGHSKSFGSFALASELIAFQRRLEQARGSSKNKGKGKKRGLVVAAGFVGKYDPTRKEATVIKTPVFSTEEGGPEKRISGGFSLFHSPRFGGTGPIGTSANILPDIHTRGGTS